MSAASCKLAIKAIPNAPRTALAGWLGDVLKVKVHAPALEGRANEELCAFIAGILGLPRRSVSLAQGDKSRQKLLHIEGLTLPEIRTRLDPLVT
ncbi:MAG: hypothetical protein K0R17_2144 [Rariglobus sp.]|jgi:uncharacterized protein (TIGR00251 family)|nr:hypothetical protein [Rariglobus sp.]